MFHCGARARGCHRPSAHAQKRWWRQLVAIFCLCPRNHHSYRTGLGCATPPHQQSHRINANNNSDLGSGDMADFVDFVLSEPDFEHWREPRPPSHTPPRSKCICYTPLIDLLCRFNKCQTPYYLHRHINRRHADNLRYLQSLSNMCEAETVHVGIGQQPYGLVLEDGAVTPEQPTITTTHLRGQQLEIFPSTLTHLGADRTLALRGYLRVTIRQYFYVRHRINLRFPHLPLVGVIGGSKGHLYYYPLECLQLVEYRDEEPLKEANP